MGIHSPFWRIVDVADDDWRPWAEFASMSHAEVVGGFLVSEKF